MNTEQWNQYVFLVVDDDNQVRDILTEYLRSFGFTQILQAKDGRGALKMLQDHQRRIDFVISDWEMPHIDGLTLLRAVRNDPHREKIKFLIVSSQGSQERTKIAKAAKSNVDAYVVKPFRASVLKEKINNLITMGSDPSAKEFENKLFEVPQEVPSNEMIARMKEKNPLGRVFLGDLPKTKTGSVVMKENVQTGISGQDLQAVVSEAQSGSSSENRLPPEKYDLRVMDEKSVLKLAQDYVAAENFDKALRLCIDAQFLFPESADIVCELAGVYFNLENFDEAERMAKKAVKLKAYHLGAQTLLEDIQLQRSKKAA